MATEISDWEELISHTDTAEDVIWTGGDLDFNEINPQGFTDTIIFKAKSIDFKGATFKNIRSYAAIALNFNFANSESFLKNLNIIDMVHNPVVNSNNHLCRVHVTKVENFTVTAVAIPSMGYSIFTATSAGSSSSITVRFFSCGFNVQAVSNDYSVRFDDTVDRAVLYADCRFIFDITQNGKQIFYKSHIVNCLISGKFDNVSGENISISTSKVMGTNVFNLSSNAKLEYTSPKLSLYNSDLATFEPNDNIIACTAEELKNPETLRKKGFPIAVVGT